MLERMPKEKLDHSEAILRKTRNTKKGLKRRNKILRFLFDHAEEYCTTKEIAKNLGITYQVAFYHLNNMLDDLVVEKNDQTEVISWKITGLGQQTIKKWL
jgi:predicted transcriptional regulator